ncbi:MAG: transglutaminase family protein [Polyangiaceae bacterium]|nr:transglutaminase family protein [Polyangiaceae bacterium]
MAIRVRLSHQTRYRYDKPINLGPQTVRLRPAPHNRTPLHTYGLHIEPKGHFLNWQQDPYGNYLARLVFPEKVDHFEVTVDLVADLEAYNPFDFFVEPEAENFPFSYEPTLKKELEPYLEQDPLTPALAAFIDSLNKTPRRVNDFLVETNRAVNEAVSYIIRLEPGVQSPEETLTLAKGSCRDSAWLLAVVLRKLGLAARFVSGYLIQLTPDQRPIEGAQGPLADFCDLHAWCEVYVPGAGWIGLDATSGLLTAEGHIPLACSPSPGSAAPISGLLDEAETDFSHHMFVERVVDVPRVTKPYTDEEWAAVEKFGTKVDEHLTRSDVRLTVGGEPTFVSTEYPDDAEWNTDALGKNKEGLADKLIRRLRSDWYPKSALYHAQGKWYPGEPLPRWAISCFFRTDGVPVWNDPALIADTNKSYDHGPKEAEAFAKRLIENLGLERHGLMPAFEDAWYYMWRARRLPVNVMPLDNRVDDEVERERIAAVFNQKLSSVVGYVLPLTYWGGWRSGSFFLKDERCYLLPGDSPMGYRLPLDSLPWIAQEDWDGNIPVDPFARQPSLPKAFHFPLMPAPAMPAPIRRVVPSLPKAEVAPNGQPKGAVPSPRGAAPGSTHAAPFTSPAQFESATGVVRTALCVEPRAGRLRIFLPPLETLEAALELIAAIETTAAQLKLPVQLEGYEPPRDPRLGVFRVTPDPGVIEVNVPPVSSFAAQKLQTLSLYEHARQVKLSAEKFDLDGTHIGSGGGYHLVLGGMTPENSPFLRRPDLLGSLIRYFHNHPSLSYLFSGRFIGPTSQSPRVDEGRNDSIYELEIALQQLPQKGQNVPPWIVDRVLRHLLADVTGNTHRTQFCIDKLYSPDSATGRLGLLELRSFEMPPHAQMAVVQQLLVGAMVASFWEQPYREDLVSWNTMLHDKFMLPYFVKRDFYEVLADLERRGFKLDRHWFEPHYQFRFPYIGHVVKDAVTLEIRGALEPWNVLGEESTGAGTARYVDSSVERLQVRVFGATPGRHIVCCNNVELPLVATGVEGEMVGGVRYRAWQPPSCLHPTIGVQSPLAFDLYDRWNGVAIAGATYHVVHPGGRADEVRPVNAAAAESRRLARFEARSVGTRLVQPRRLEPHPKFPFTLDLRRAWLA